MRGECVTASQQLHIACMNFEARVSQESSSSGVEMSALEKQLKNKLKEVMQLQGCWDAEKVELNSRWGHLQICLLILTWLVFFWEQQRLGMLYAVLQYKDQ